MPDECIWASGHHGLPLLYLNGRRRITVRLHYPEEQHERQYDDCVADKRHDGRNRRPTEAMVEGGKYHECYEPEHEKRRDELLSRSLLRHRPDVHATLNELSVVHEEIDAQRLRRYRERDYEGPRLPVVERARRKKEAGEQNCNRYQVRQYPAYAKIT